MPELFYTNLAAVGDLVTIIIGTIVWKHSARLGGLETDVAVIQATTAQNKAD